MTNSVFHFMHSAFRIPYSALVVLTAYAFSGVYFVAPDQQAVVVRFGQVVAKGVTPGVHYSLPWPIDSVYKLKVLETKRLTIGIEMPDQALGRIAAENPTEYLTGDQNLINIRMAVQYAVKDPAAFLFRRSEERRVGKECRTRWSP